MRAPRHVHAGVFQRDGLWRDHDMKDDSLYARRRRLDDVRAIGEGARARRMPGAAQARFMAMTRDRAVAFCTQGLWPNPVAMMGDRDAQPNLRRRSMNQDT